MISANRRGSATTNSMTAIENRLKTFDTWPISHIIHPYQLAHAGLYYLNVNNVTKCVSCRGLITQWSEGDDPDVSHKTRFPFCPFVRKVIKPRLEIKKILQESNVTENMNVFEEISDCGFIMHKKPHKPELVTVSSRLQTFENWSKRLLPKCDILAEAGFYYTGRGTEVCCFYCAGGIKEWEPTDDPWIEHARHFSKCNYILLTKGEEFVKEISENIGTVDNIQSGNDIVTNTINAQKYEETLRTDVSNYEEEIFILETENRKLKELQESRLCKICIDEDASVVFLPCRHLAVCTNCVLNIQTCPVCRKPIKFLIKTYL